MAELHKWASGEIITKELMNAINNALTAVIYHNGSILGETGKYVLNNISTYK